MNTEVKDKLYALLPGEHISDEEQPYKDYHFVQTLGEGAFGEVQLIVNSKLPRVALAVKKLSLDELNEQKITVIRKEYLLQQRCSRPNGSDNVIKVYGCKHNSEWCYMFLEYADGGELFDKIEPDVGMPAAIAQFYFRQLISGLKYIHHMDIVHRDIKPENLLLTNAHFLKISDFGMATLYRSHGVERQLDVSCGTVPYAAPEVVAGKKYSGPPIDIWSAGIVLIAMLTGELPWDRACDRSEAYSCWLDNTNLDEAPWNKIDVRALCILRKIVTDNVIKRATIEQIMVDPWYQHNYGRLDTCRGRPLKRRHHDSEENIQNNTAHTQQVELESTAKRRHLETPSEKTTAQKQNASFSQPTYTDDLLLTQHIDMSQTNSNLLQRMVCRMTRFCVNVGVHAAAQKVAAASEHSGYNVRNMDNSNLRFLVTCREVSMMVNLYTMTQETGEATRVMIDFRRSKGDGIQFKKMFLEVRDRMHDIICPDGNNWLADVGFTPKDPQFVTGDQALSTDNFDI